MLHFTYYLTLNELKHNVTVGKTTKTGFGGTFTKKGIFQNCPDQFSLTSFVTLSKLPYDLLPLSTGNDIYFLTKGADCKTPMSHSLMRAFCLFGVSFINFI